MSQTKLSPKEFALQQIAPYYKDRSTCGYKENRGCFYLAPNGNMCVAGKNMLQEVLDTYETDGTSIGEILAINNEDQSKVFRAEAVDVLTKEQWQRMQLLHDTIAKGREDGIIHNRVETLDLFTFKELQEYSEKL